MKKGLTLAIMALAIFALVGTAAASLEITNGFQIAGEGDYYSELMLQSNKSYDGLKMLGAMATPGLGVFGSSKLNLSNEYIFSTNNDSELELAEVAVGTNLDRKLCLKNYELGTAQGFNFKGNFEILSEFSADYNMSAMAIEALVLGEGRTKVEVKRPDVPHELIALDEKEFEGMFTLQLDNLVLRIDDPEADCENWLGCP